MHEMDEVIVLTNFVKEMLVAPLYILKFFLLV